MRRRGAMKQEFLLVLLVLVALGGLTVYLTLRGETKDPHSFIRDELNPTTANPASPGEEPKDIPKDQQKEITTDSGLRYTDTRTGVGDKVKIGSRVKVIYTGTFINGEKFDSNVGKEPYEVTVGVSSVIQGWHEGLIGTQKGTKRKLYIPSKLAYGEGGRQGIPPNSDLKFEMEIVSVVTRQ